MADREYDIIVWGATGFTGKLVVEYLVNTYGVDGELSWAIAGRNRNKLDEVRNSFLAAGERELLPALIADSEDLQSLRELCKQARVICTTVGPYARYGTPLVEACAESGTDYCDLTGEVQWMARVIPEYEQMAVASNARIVHTCGFDSVPFDMGNWHVQQLMQEKHGVYARQVKGRVGASKGGASGGTIASILNMLEEAEDDPGLRDQLENPYLLYPGNLAPGPAQPDQTGPVFDEDFEQWTSPFIMATINTRVVRRSNALLGLPWGEDFRYDEAVLNRSRLQSRLLSAGSALGMTALSFKPTRKIAERLMPKPGEGPSREVREAGYYSILFHAIHPEDRSQDLRLEVSGDMDPGYGSTSKMLAEAAVCLAKDTALTKGGFWTPSSALGAAYLERLQRSAGLQFTLIRGD